MFGYVNINKPEMKIRDYETYRSYYCGLCTALKKSCGLAGQMSLSYDMTFLYILLTDLYEPETKVVQRHCLAHPFSSHPARINEIADYVADMNVLLTYYKCMDDWRDERKLLRLIYGKDLRRCSRKQRRKYREKIRIMRGLLEDIWTKEKENCQDPDEMAGLFGQIMSEVFAYRKDEWEDELQRIGYNLGKFTYLVDAYEDIYDDVKKGYYNPLKERLEDPGFEADARTTLTLIMADCCKDFEILPLVEEVDILRNILYSGIWCRFETIQAERVGSKEQEKTDVL
ncbi:MAG: DUF5685 family protein [Lachnospiraceae bacterium]|nr:DUF5685 family protein [Lachnospiraceae bacterium]